MSYKLTYFNFAARGEPARIMFAAAGVKFIDNRIQREDWPALKASLGGIQLPILQVGDKTLTQSKAIFRYLGYQFRLVEPDVWKCAKCDELVDTVEDIMKSYAQFTFHEQDPAKKEKMKTAFKTKTLPTFLQRINNYKIENQNGNWLIGEKMTWADIVTAEYLRQISQSIAEPSMLQEYPNILKMQNAVYSNSNVKAYREAVKI